MTRKIQLLTGVYVLAAAMSLSFGPTPAAAASAVLACTKAQCQLDCENLGLDRGQCISGECVCTRCKLGGGELC
jgi:hypothetical protein